MSGTSQSVEMGKLFAIGLLLMHYDRRYGS